MNLPHIDNSHFKLTTAQAKQLCCDGKLPGPGIQKRAKSGTTVTLDFPDRSETFQIVNDSHAWVTETPLAYWKGKWLKSGRTWALFIHFPLN